MQILSLGVVWFVLLFCYNPCVMGGMVPGFLPEGNLFKDCEDSDFKPFRNKCLRVVTDNTMSWGALLSYCNGFPVLLESDEERQFYFDVLLRGRETYVFQFADPNEGSLIYAGPPIDPAYLESQTFTNIGVADPMDGGLNCLIRENDIKECEEVDLDDANYNVTVPCAQLRPLFEGESHECDMRLKKKFRRDAKRTIKMANDYTDICYLRVKTRRFRKASLVKIYSHSFPETQECVPGFFITANTKLVVSGTSLPPLKCGEKLGFGRPLYKKKSGLGGEIRIFFVMNGDGTPLYIRAKGTSFIL